MKINKRLLREMIKNNGGIRKLSTESGLSRQAIYNTLNGRTPNYYTICLISEFLQMTNDQLLKVWFDKEISK